MNCLCFKLKRIGGGDGTLLETCAPGVADPQNGQNGRETGKKPGQGGNFGPPTATGGPSVVCRDDRRVGAGVPGWSRNTTVAAAAWA